MERKYDHFNLGFGFSAEDKLVYRSLDAQSFRFEKRSLNKPFVTLVFPLIQQRNVMVSVHGAYGIIFPQNADPYRFKQGSSMTGGLKFERSKNNKTFGANIYMIREEYPISGFDLKSTETGIKFFYSFE